ncbi:MAG: CFI-box-CTERM domain-containing protein [Planctomycetota bacterium]
MSRAQAAKLPMSRGSGGPPVSRILTMAMLAVLGGAWLLEGSPLLAQAQPKRIYIAPDDHTDYFWTADDGTYEQAFLTMLDYYLDLADSTSTNPAEFQSRWNCDGSYWIWVYQKRRSAAAFERLIGRVRDGHITFPLNALVVCLGGAPTEAVLRGMYYTGQLERRYGLRVPVAVAMENQTLPFGLGSLWEGSGARYTWKGICGCDTQVPDAWDREHDIYWMEGADGSRVLMKWNSMLNGNQSMGGYAEARDPGQVVEYVGSDPDFRARYPYDVIGAFGKGWDDLETRTDEFITVAQAKTNGDRSVIVSNQQDFFADFAATYGSGIPVQACSFGNEWDLYCAALAEVTARVRRAVEKLRGAEALATLVSWRDPAFLDGRSEARDLAWIDLGLFWEHNFGMVNPQTGEQGTAKRLEWQRRLAGEIETYVDDLHADASQALGTMVKGGSTNLRLYAFNPLGWTRTDVADLPFAEEGPLHVIDLDTGEEAPSQLIQVSGSQLLRVLASDLPAVGYKVFEVRHGEGERFEAAASVSGGVIESDEYKVTVAKRGAITSLLDKRRGSSEFARTIDDRAINDLGPSSGSLQVENAGPVSVTLVAQAPSPVAHTTRITLLRGSRRIEIRNDIEANFETTLTWGFSFKLAAPDVWHEELGAVIRAKLLQDGGHYSARNARYDWLTLNHFADMTEGSGARGVTLSNIDCCFMRLGRSTPSQLDAETPQLAVLAGGRVVNGDQGLRAQGGDSHFLQRFALMTHGEYDPLTAMRFALEHQNPLVTGVVTGREGYPPKSYSFLSISDPNVVLWALKPADDGIERGILARVWNLSPESVDYSLTVQGSNVVHAEETTHIETYLEDLSATGDTVEHSIGRHELATLCIQAESLEPGDGDGSGTGGGGGGGGGSTCLAVVAASGSALSSHLDLLREFRDRYLLKNAIGARLASMYYAGSPRIAKAAAQHDVLRWGLRSCLWPVVGLCALVHQVGPLPAAALAALPIALAISLLRSLVGKHGAGAEPRRRRKSLLAPRWRSKITR